MVRSILMKRRIRYRKPEWVSWIEEPVEENERDKRIAVLESLGYIVEK
jgi:hypothetical protein